MGQFSKVPKLLIMHTVPEGPRLWTRLKYRKYPFLTYLTVKRCTQFTKYVKTQACVRISVHCISKCSPAFSKTV